MFSIVSLQSRFAKDPWANSGEERQYPHRSNPHLSGLWRPELSGWNLQNFILELWGKTALLFLRPLCHKEGSFGKHDTKAESLIPPL